ncbi:MULTISPECIES: hypothetical protein [Microbacterium]|uniref:hypothetical protein n=1 Tax=Microbacterium TaxID=33882 RepID=UPI001C307445
MRLPAALVFLRQTWTFSTLNFFLLCAEEVAFAAFGFLTGDALDVRAMREGMRTKPFLQGYRKLVDVKLEILEADERWLTVRGRFARFGFIALCASIAIATAATLASTDATPPAAPPSPAVPSSR